MRIKRLGAIILAGALCVSTLAGCGLNKNETVASFGDQKITLGIVNFVCRYQQAKLEDSYKGYFGDEVWSKDLYGNGGSLQESTKHQVLDDLENMYLLKAHMDDYGVSLTEEEKQNITDTAKAFMDENDSKALDEMGATQEIVEEMLTLYTIKSKMYDAIIKDVDTNVTDEEANMRAYTMLKLSLAGGYDDNQQYVEYTDDQKAEIKAKAQAIFNSITSPSDLEEAGKAYDYTATTGTYDADDSTLNADVKTALDGLNVGEMSNLIVTDDAVYIVRLDSDCDADATEKNRESILNDRKDTLYNDTLSGWKEDKKWEVDDKALEKIQFKNSLTQQEESTETEQTQVNETVDGTEAAK